MAGYTDRITRSLALDSGASLAFTEMISAEALSRGSAHSIDMMKRAAEERILAVQLFGYSPESLGNAAVIAAAAGADLLDLNAGCPVRKVTERGAGAALARNPRILAEAVRRMTGPGLPVTVKLRKGWNEDDLSWKDAVKAAVESGAAAVAFHPRTRNQGYGGKADWTALAELVSTVKVPVIGSGDLDSPRACRDMLLQTSCAAVMVARGAVGDPDIFRRIRILLTENRQAGELSPVDRIITGRKHLQQAAAAFGDEIAAREMKKHLARYIRGWPSSSELRLRLMKTSSFQDLLFELENALQVF
jgi:nifR3 family TIM-barrel protein